MEAEEAKSKENVKFSPDDTFTSDDGGGGDASKEVKNEDHAKEAKMKATPAVNKRRQATRHFVVQSPTDHIFSPCTQKLLHPRKRPDTAEDI